MPNRLFSRFVRNEDGAVTVEYVVLAALVAGVAYAAVEMNVEGQETYTSTLSYALTGETDEEFLTVDIANGSFELVAGMATRSWGYSAESIEGWIPESGHDFEIKVKSEEGSDSYDADHYLDMGESPGNLEISQVFDNVDDGEWYTIGLTAYDKIGDNSMEVYFGGEFVGLIEANTSEWEQYDFAIKGGMGDGTNKITLRETGTVDNTGTYIDSVGLYAMRDKDAERAEAAATEAEAGS